MKSSGWERLRHGENKENISADLSNSFFRSSPVFNNVWRPSPELDLKKDFDKTYVIQTNSSDSNNESQSSSPCSSGYGSFIQKPETPLKDFKIHIDDFTSSFNSLLKPVSDKEEPISQDLMSFIYSPLSSFNFFDNGKKRLSGFPELEEICK